MTKYEPGKGPPGSDQINNTQQRTSASVFLASTAAGILAECWNRNSLSPIGNNLQRGVELVEGRLHLNKGAIGEAFKAGVNAHEKHLPKVDIPERLNASKTGTAEASGTAKDVRSEKLKTTATSWTEGLTRSKSTAPTIAIEPGGLAKKTDTVKSIVLSPTTGNERTAESKMSTPAVVPESPVSFTGVTKAKSMRTPTAWGEGVMRTRSSISASASESSTSIAKKETIKATVPPTAWGESTGANRLVGLSSVPESVAFTGISAAKPAIPTSWIDSTGANRLVGLSSVPESAAFTGISTAKPTIPTSWIDSTIDNRLVALTSVPESVMTTIASNLPVPQPTDAMLASRSLSANPNPTTAIVDNSSTKSVDLSTSNNSSQATSDSVIANNANATQDTSQTTTQKTLVASNNDSSKMQSASRDSQTPEKHNSLDQTGQTMIANNEVASVGHSPARTIRSAVNSDQAPVQTGHRNLDQAFDALLANNAGQRIIPDAACPVSRSADTGTVPIPGVLTNGSLFNTLARESNSVSTLQGLTTGQSSGLYVNETVARGQTGQGALLLKEAGSAQGGLITNDGRINLASIGPGRGLIGALQTGEGVQGGQINRTAIGPGQVLMSALQNGDGIRSMGQGIAMLTPGQGAIKGIDDTSKIPISLINDNRLTFIDTSTGKKGSTALTEGMNPNAIGSPLGLITTKGGGKVGGLDVIDENKLPQAQTPTTQSPLGLIVASTTTSNTTATTNNTTPNNQQTGTTTNTTPTTKLPADWADTLPEIELVDRSEKENIEPVKQETTLTRKEVVVHIDGDLDDDDDEYDQFVANEGKRGGGAFTPQSRPFDNVRSLIEIIIADANGSKLDGNKANQLFELLHGDSTRRQYIVKPGDTIEEIALRMLKDKRLIPLLLDVNELKGLRLAGAKKTQVDMSDAYTSPLKAGVLLELPSIPEILRYKIHRLKDETLYMVYANTLSGDDHSVRGDEKDSEYIAYTCRLGDTLKSVAKRYPAIADESRWQEIAQLNELSTECNADGQPTAVLSRGQTIHLPRPKQIVDELEYEGEDESQISSIDAILSTGGYGQKRANKSRVHKALIQNHDGQTVVPGKVVSFMGRMKSATVSLETTEAGITARVITQNDLGENTSNLMLRLEMKLENQWLPVVEYVINPPGSSEESGLKIYDLYGVRQVIPLALPTRAARELAENDITVNSQRYCQLFIKDHQLAA